MIATSRRSLITGLAALVAAPAIVKVASLMPVNAALQPGVPTLDDFVRDLLDPMIDRLAHDRADALRYMIEAYPNGELKARHVSDWELYKGEQWPSVDVAYGAIGNDKLSPDDVRDLMVKQVEGANEIETRWAEVSRIPYDVWRKLQYNKERRSIDVLPVAIGPLALAAAAVVVAPAVLEKPVTRRFWAK